MSAVKYTLGRIGLFLAVMLVLYPVPKLSLLVKMLVAVVASAALSWCCLSVAGRVRRGAGGPQRRKVEKERLRAALAGERKRRASRPRPSRRRRAVHGRAGPGRTPPLTTPQFRSSSLPWSVRDGHSATTRAPRVGSRELTSPRP